MFKTLFLFGTFVTSSMVFASFHPKKSTDLPSLVICVKDQRFLSSSEDQEALMKIVSREKKKIPHCVNLATKWEKAKDSAKYHSIKIRVPRRSTSRFSKNDFLFVTTSNGGDLRTFAPLGLKEGSSFRLLGGYLDRSQFQNALGFRLSEKIKNFLGGEFSPGSSFVEVWLGDDFLGLYVLVEEVSGERHRLGLDAFNPERPDQLSFVGELALGQGGGLSRTKKGTPFKLRDPSYEMVKEWKRFKLPGKSFLRNLKTHLGEFESSLRSGDGASFGKFIDVSSFVNYMLLAEVFKNVHAYRNAGYIYKDISTKLRMGPISSFDEGFGNLSFYTRESEMGWLFVTPKKCFFRDVFWFSSLIKDRHFAEMFIERYKRLREKGAPLDEAQIQKEISAIAEEASTGPERNQKRWVGIFERAGAHGHLTSFEAGSHADSVKRLQTWLVARLRWMDEHVTDILKK